jgi:hypothetical protein
MGTYSEDFQGGATTANTLLTLTPTTGWQVPPGNFMLYQADVGLAGIVDAKECAGALVIQVSGQGGGTWAFAIGGGVGATTAGSAKPSEKVQMAIPLKGGQIVIVKIITAEVSNDQRVGLRYMEGSGPACMTLHCGGAGQDSTAGTELLLTVDAKLDPVNMTPWRDGIIRQIRFTGSGIIAALAAATRLRISIPGQADVYKFVVRSGNSGATTSAQEETSVIEDLNIPVKNGQTVSARILTTATTGQAILSAGVTLVCY